MRLASGGPAIGSIYNITPQPDGKLVIGGMFDEYDGHSRSCLARIDANGALDPDFHVGAGVRSGSTVGAVWSIARQDDGKLLLSGLFTTYDGVARKNLARVNADGSLDATFNTGGGPNNVVRAVAVQPDGKVLIAGPFTAYDQVPRAGWHVCTPMAHWIHPLIGRGCCWKCWTGRGRCILVVASRW